MIPNVPLWATLLVAVLTSGIVGTVLGAFLHARFERKAALHGRAIEELASFSEDAARWVELTEAAVRARATRAALTMTRL